MNRERLTFVESSFSDEINKEVVGENLVVFVKDTQLAMWLISLWLNI